MAAVAAIVCAACAPMRASADAADAYAETLLRDLRSAPYVTPLTPETRKVALVRRVGSGFELSPLETTASTAQGSVPAWLRRHRTMGATSWFVALDPTSQRPVYWAPLSDSVVLDEVEGHVFRAPYADSGIVVPYDPKWDTRVLKMVPGAGGQPQKLKKSSSGMVRYARLNQVRVATAPQPVDLVFLSAGFESTELDRYRRAVECVTAGLLNDDAFKSHAGAFNVWRMDLYVDSSASYPVYNGQDPLCAPQAFGTVGEPPRPATKKYDLEVEAQSGISTLVWFKKKAIKTGAVYKDIKAMLGHDPLLVIALLDDGDVKGGGDIGHGVAIASLASIQSLEHRLASHELGHALGLYDEHVEWDAIPPVAYTGVGPNIMTKEEAAAGQTPTNWSAACTNKLCEDYVRDGNPCLASGKAPTTDTLGFFRGANFSCDFVAPVEICRMNTFSNDPFCKVCAAHIGQALSAATALNPTGMMVVPGNMPSAPVLPGPHPNVGGSGDTVARISVGGVIGEVVVRCFEVAITEGAGQVSKRVVSVPATGAPVSCPIQGESMDVGELLRIVTGAEGRVKVDRIIDDVTGKSWDAVHSLDLQTKERR